MHRSIVPSTAAEMHPENHRYWMTVSKETQSEGFQWELKAEKWENLKTHVYRGRGKRHVNNVKDNWRVSWARDLSAKARANSRQA